MKYANPDGRHDTYWRALPKTDDPAECLEYLVEWWRSKRRCEAELYGEGKPDAGTDYLLTEALLTAEEEAIEHLLDNLADARPVLRSWAIRSALYDLVAHAEMGTDCTSTDNMDAYVALRVATMALREERDG